jgi:ADP-ribosylglycohydrolase
MMRLPWAQPEELLRSELRQSADEGRDVSAIEQRWVQAGGATGELADGLSPEPVSAELATLARELLDELDALPETGISDEPSGWPEILTAVQGRIPAPAARPGTAELRDRIHGAWLGRAVGCVLGKPVEKIPRAGIEEILRAQRRWPLDRWFTAVGLDPDVAARWPWNVKSRPTSLEENIDGTPEDDDLNYTLLALKVIEQHGPSFTADDVAMAWLLDLPAGRTFTAERVAYRNLLDGVGPPQSARIRNPFREWIGAQIRTDLYGWVNPGDLERAAEWAWRDASVSHTRNGIYGALYAAALGAAAVSAGSIEAVLDAAETVLPPRSRLAQAVRLGRDLAVEVGEPTKAYARLEAEFSRLHWVHVLNNAALLTYGLAAGAGDFDRTITLVVMGGWDTDSNGATAGAVAGGLGGAGVIGPQWSGPLGNRLATSIPGMDGVTFDELTDRTFARISASQEASNR